MVEVDFDKLLKLAESDKAAKNAMTFTDLIKEAEGVIKLVERVVSVFDRAGALPGLVRAVGKRYGVDVETPLQTRADPNAITPISDQHRQVFQELNGIPAEDLKKQFEEAAKLLKKNAAAQIEPGPG